MKNDISPEALALVPLNYYTAAPPMPEEAFKTLPIANLKSKEAKKKFKQLSDRDDEIRQEEINDMVFCALEKEYHYQAAVLKDKRKIHLLAKKTHELMCSLIDFVDDYGRKNWVNVKKYQHRLHIIFPSVNKAKKKDQNEGD